MPRAHRRMWRDFVYEKKPIEVFGIGRQDRADMADAGVVDQHVAMADALGEFFTRFWIGNIQSHEFAVNL